jgi:hypothetical protein
VHGLGTGLHRCRDLGNPEPGADGPDRIVIIVVVAEAVRLVQATDPVYNGALDDDAITPSPK